jgi:hypothetical protein
VIVKKVPPSKAAGPKSIAANVRDLADYIAGPKAGGDGEKVEHRGTLNLLNVDHAAQVQEMIDLAEIARRDAKPVQHWILSWREDEQPTAAQADEAVRMFLSEMGLSDHQAIYALHSDTDNWHLHLAVNRVHPETEKVVTVNKGYDLKVAHRAIARIELRHGWQSEGRALYAPGQDGELTLVRSAGPTTRRPSARALSFEERVGACSAERIAAEDVAPVIGRARTWGEVHEGLARIGVRFERKGSGALLWIGDQPVKASAAGRACSMAALQKRLGAFEPALPMSPPEPVKARPVDRASPLLRVYLDRRENHYRDRAAARSELRDTQRKAWRDLATRHQRERSELFDGSWRGKGIALNAFRSVTAARQAQEKAALREQQQTERSQLVRERGRFPPYEEWLATGDRDAAQEWRHRVRRPATIEGPTFEQPTVRDIRSCSALVDGSRVHYYLGGGHRRPAFTDRGQRIDVFDSHNRETVLSALQLGAQKWGTVVVAGDERYKRLCVELAAEHGFKIANPDLAPAIAAERERLRRVEALENSPPPAERNPRLLTPEAIYGRHLAEVVQQNQGWRVDPSRLDGEIAVRLAATGHGRDAMATVIREGARATRPGEFRDWTLYAQRAADFAFSPLAQELHQRLVGQEERLLRLEGRQHEEDLRRRLGGPFRYL